MVNARKEANKIESEREKAIAYHDNVVPPMDIIRYHIDKLELMVDDEMWPLPKYRELLFIRKHYLHREFGKHRFPVFVYNHTQWK